MKYIFEKFLKGKSTNKISPYILCQISDFWKSMSQQICLSLDSALMHCRYSGTNLWLIDWECQPSSNEVKGKQRVMYTRTLFNCFWLNIGRWIPTSTLWLLLAINYALIMLQFSTKTKNKKKQHSERMSCLLM